MNIWLSLLLSLLLTSLVSFALPIVLFTVVLAILGVMGHLPLISPFINYVYAQIWQFLAIFGEGSGIFGILIIAVTCAIAGLLFESLNFYRYRLLINKPLKPLWQKPKTAEIISKIICSNDK
ncbi:hypothetical protein [Cyanobacterium sp. Dongsha4]|uniref:hypothetical protein n=1 Tax=Cyanobacterium sp. DS4 TaxID=2878255 RepID=UPI002E81519B|nr:hypothetical protein [Cyanobacterium sp. Dongsha4]WVK99059.1 hypothetical protein Dongsha4_10130 [Cyanobacterium sp. Dongsha4]